MRSVRGISQKMLTQTLRELEHNGIAQRISQFEVPLRVEYRLTTLGKSLSELARAMEQWVVTNYPTILAERLHGRQDDDGAARPGSYILYRNRIGQSAHHPGNAVNGVAPEPPRPGVRATFMTQQTIAKYPTIAASSTTPGSPKRCTASA
jgi:hypothetical protein